MASFSDELGATNFPRIPSVPNNRLTFAIESPTYIID